jgi:hypothetical protein
MNANNTGSDLWAALAARHPIMGIDAVGLRDIMYERTVNDYGDFAQSDPTGSPFMNQNSCICVAVSPSELQFLDPVGQQYEDA